VGFEFADAFYVVPAVTDPNYLDKMIEICAREEVDWVMPCIDSELVLLRENDFRILDEGGAQLFLASTGVLRICTDKLATHDFFEAHGIRAIPTEPWVKGYAGFQWPCIVKPRQGSGSESIYFARSQVEADFFGLYIGGTVGGRVVMQPFIEGEEYTVDVLVDVNKEPLIISPRIRCATEAGVSVHGITYWDELVVSGVTKIIESLGIVYAANIQCFVQPDGGVLFGEINARVAGSSIFTQLAGIPFYESIVEMMRGKHPAKRVRPAREKHILRYWSEVVQ
jgi:carbamoyl-phosphate synthase large subunit